jgi:diguanylate cyclase (GGDEF)-like protein
VSFPLAMHTCPRPRSGGRRPAAACAVLLCWAAALAAAPAPAPGGSAPAPAAGSAGTAAATAPAAAPAGSAPAPAIGPAGISGGGKADAAAAERGFPLIQSYVPGLRQADSQTFGVALDPAGVLYVGGSSGVLVYDGAWWRLIRVGKGKAAFSLAADASGRVAIGGDGDLGYLAADAAGSLRFVSLLPLLPAAQRDFGQVMSVEATAAGFVYMTARRLLLWDGAALTTLGAFPGDRPHAQSFLAGDAVYVWTREGIVKLVGRKLAPVPGGEQFRGRRVDAILAGSSADGGLLVSVRGEGLYRLRAGGAEPFAPQASRWAAENRLYCGLRLDDGRWALGSIKGGLLLLSPDGTVDRVIDGSVGLPDDFVTGLAVDREGGLWVALDSGLARVEAASPLSVVDARSGLKGAVHDLARYRGELWAATSAGMFTFGRSGGDAAGSPAGATMRMRPVNGLPVAGWSLLAAGEDLLVGTAFGLYVVRGADRLRVPGTQDLTVYWLLRSRADPEQVWAGLEEGLGVFRRRGGQWHYEGLVEGVPRDVRTIVEGRAGTLWFGTTASGSMGMRISGGSAGSPPRAVAVARIKGCDGVELFRTADGILGACDGRVWRLDEGTATLAEDAPLAALRSGEAHAAGGPLSSLREDAEGNLWMNSRPPAVAVRRGTAWAPRLRSLVEVPAREISDVFAEPSGVVWLMAEHGLFRYAGPFRRSTPPLPRPRLARITLGGGTLVHGGAAAPPNGLELASDVRRLRIELAPLAFRAGLRFQTRLDPVDAEWSAAAAEPFAELTRLPAGRYTFRARTIGPSGERGPPAAWSFRVLPPWYQGLWAWVVWVGAGFYGIVGYGRLRSRALRQRAARLEARVTEQTVELRRRVEELRRAHAELASANVRLEELTLQDELTGVANRRALQKALEEEWSRARRHRLPIAMALLDLDHFKLLNDAYGHPEGDVGLRAVAHHLAATVRRPGDLVARFGGEELAVLLPNTDLAGAERLAEQLRQGIEGLAIHHPASGRLTASFGVAAFIPGARQEAEELIAAADRALYRAKSEGRNRVRVAEAGDGRVPMSM